MKYDKETIRAHACELLWRCPSPEYAAQQLGRLANEGFPFYVVFREKPSADYSEDNKRRRIRCVLAKSNEDPEPINIDAAITVP